MWCAKSCIENIYYVLGFWFTYSFSQVTYSNVKCFSADRQVSESSRYQQFKYSLPVSKFCVYLSKQVSVSADTDLKSIDIELKILVSPITIAVPVPCLAPLYIQATSCNVHYSGSILYDNERETWSKSTLYSASEFVFCLFELMFPLTAYSKNRYAVRTYGQPFE